MIKFENEKTNNSNKKPIIGVVSKYIKKKNWFGYIIDTLSEGTKITGWSLNKEDFENTITVFGKKCNNWEDVAEITLRYVSDKYNGKVEVDPELLLGEYVVITHDGNFCKIVGRFPEDCDRELDIEGLLLM